MVFIGIPIGDHIYYIDLLISKLIVKIERRSIVLRHNYASLAFTEAYNVNKSGSVK